MNRPRHEDAVAMVYRDGVLHLFTRVDLYREHLIALGPGGFEFATHLEAVTLDRPAPDPAPIPAPEKGA